MSQNLQSRHQLGHCNPTSKPKSLRKLQQPKSRQTEKLKTKLPVGWAAASSLATAQFVQADSSWAQEPEAATQTSSGIGGLLIIFAPIVLYVGFSLYRQFINPKAKLSDFLLIAAAAVVFGNIIGIAFFQIRIY